LLAAAALVASASCLPLEGDLDNYSRDRRQAEGGGETTLGSLQEEPPPSTTPPGNEDPTPEDDATPGTDGNPDDPTLSNPDPDPGDRSNGSEVPPEESPQDEPASANPCPDGIANGAGTGCYFVSTEALAWTAARTACQTWGGDLVIMDTLAEDAFVATLTAESVWIGGSDITAENAFIWVDGRPLPDVPLGNWGAAQPDSFPGQDCVEKREEPQEPWYDQLCATPFAFVCEKPAAAQATATTQ
jgi:hypothetical protein